MKRKLNKNKQQKNATKTPDGKIGRKKKNLINTLRTYVDNAGLWQGPKAKGTYSAYVAGFILIIYVATLVVTLFLVMDDVAKLFECFSILTFCCMAVFKLHSLGKCSKEWLAVLKQSQELEDYTSCNHHVNVEYESEEELVARDNLVERNIKSYQSQFRSTLKFINRIYNFTLLIFLLTPFVEYAYRIIIYVEIEGYPHILPGWAPLDRLGLVVYVVTIVFEIIASVYCVVIHLAFDVTSVGLMIFLSGQFALLRERSAKIGGGGKDYQLTLERDSRAHYRIIQCHRSHIILIK